jgi:adenine deaminase
MAPYLEHPRVLGLAEVMNYPGVLGASPEVLKKLRLAENRPETLRPARVDGHAPGVLGKDLNAYLAAGIDTDHEAVTPGELSEKVSAGMFMLLREGTAAKNLLSLLPAVNHFNSRYCALATDDRHALDLVEEGSVNHLVRIAMASGLIAIPELLNMASLNGALHYGLRHTGALAPGYKADMALYQDLWSFRPSMVWKDGALAAKDGECLMDRKEGFSESEKFVRNSVKLGELSAADFKVRGKGMARIIGVRPQSIETDLLTAELPSKNGVVRPDPESGVAKIAVCDRYRARHKPAVGFIRGLGLKRGAISSTVSHDSHNLVIAGASDEDMLVCLRRTRELEGGQVAALGGKVLREVALPLGGLMSTKSLRETAADIRALLDCLPALGFPPGSDPFMTLSFMSLPVIPSLKLTASGLVDVNRFEIVPLFV